MNINTEFDCYYQECETSALFWGCWFDHVIGVTVFQKNKDRVVFYSHMN